MEGPVITIPLGRGGELVEAIFLARPNRFLVEAQLGDTIVQAHLADRGRLKETLVLGARLLLARASGAGRKTAFQAVAAYRGTELTSIDTQLPNRLVEAALRAQALVPFARYPEVRRESREGSSRFDFRLAAGTEQCLLEVKSAGLVIDGVAWFPDAPTDRGRRHLQELAMLAKEGIRTAVVFIAQGQAQAVAMNRQIDPAFADTLDQARADGLEVYAYTCPLTSAGISLGEPVPIMINAAN